MANEHAMIRLSELTSVQAYDLLAATIVPRPIAFVSTLSSSGVANLAPFSFFMAGGSNPPSLMYSPTLNKNGEPKDSLRNVLETGEFVVNSVHREMATGMNNCSIDLPPDTSEWQTCGFTPTPSVTVKPPRVREALVQYECKLFNVFEHGDGPNAARYVVGEVLLAHLHPSLAGAPEIVRLISRIGGRNYLDMESGEIFEMGRPRIGENPT